MGFGFGLGLRSRARVIGMECDAPSTSSRRGAKRTMAYSSDLKRVPG